MSHKQAKRERQEIRFWLSRSLAPIAIVKQTGAPLRRVMKTKRMRDADAARTIARRLQARDRDNGTSLFPDALRAAAMRLADRTK